MRPLSPPIIEPNCPSWEYEHHEKYQQLIQKRTQNALESLDGLTSESLKLLCLDTRSHHGAYFKDLTPEKFPHYAGHYRGEDLSCLRTYWVHIPSDPMVGKPPYLVSTFMNNFAVWLDQSLSVLHNVESRTNPKSSDAEKFYYKISVVASLFVYFLEIHPYANGNGHMGRLMVLALFRMFGIRPKSFAIDPKPSEPTYSECIAAHRRGKPQLLERFLISLI